MKYLWFIYDCNRFQTCSNICWILVYFDMNPERSKDVASETEHTATLRWHMLWELLWSYFFWKKKNWYRTLLLSAEICWFAYASKTEKGVGAARFELEPRHECSGTDEEFKVDLTKGRGSHKVRSRSFDQNRCLRSSAMNSVMS